MRAYRGHKVLRVSRGLRVNAVLKARLVPPAPLAQRAIPANVALKVLKASAGCPASQARTVSAACPGSVARRVTKANKVLLAREARLALMA